MIAIRGGAADDRGSARLRSRRRPPSSGDRRADARLARHADEVDVAVARATRRVAAEEREWLRRQAMGTELKDLAVAEDLHPPKRRRRRRRPTRGRRRRLVERERREARPRSRGAGSSTRAGRLAALWTRGPRLSMIIHRNTSVGRARPTRPPGLLARQWMAAATSRARRRGSSETAGECRRRARQRAPAPPSPC